VCASAGSTVTYSLRPSAQARGGGISMIYRQHALYLFASGKEGIQSSIRKNLMSVMI
jgi:hypothetical protein